jgi:hypothetical protein
MAAATSLQRPDELQPLTRSTPLLSLPSLSGDDSARNVTPVEVALWLAAAAVTFRSLEATSAAAMMVGVSAADRTSFLAVRLAMDDSLLQAAVKALLHGCGYTGLTALRLRPWLQAASEASRDSKVWNEVMQHPAATPAVFRFLRVTGGADDEGDLTPRRRRQRDVALSLASDAVACVISASVDTAELKTDLAFAAFTHADSGGGSCYAHNRHIHYIPSAVDIVTARASPVTATVPVEPSYVFLETLSVRFCGLRDVGQLCGATPKLRRLVLSNNVLISLPLELIAGHPSLTYLDVSVNRLDGFHRMKKTPALTPHIAKECRLVHFDLSCNAFSGEFPPLPTILANDLALLTFPLLEALDLNGNAGVRGISNRFLDRLPRGVLKFIGLAGCTTNDRASLKRTASLHFNLKPSAIQNIDAVTDGIARADGSAASALSHLILPHERTTSALEGNSNEMLAGTNLKRAMYAVYAAVSLARCARLRAANRQAESIESGPPSPTKSQMQSPQCTQWCGAFSSSDKSRWRQLQSNDRSWAFSHMALHAALFQAPI